MESGQDYFFGAGAGAGAGFASGLAVVDDRSGVAAGGAGNCGVGRVKGPFWPQPPKIVNDSISAAVRDLALFLPLNRDNTKRLFMG